MSRSPDKRPFALTSALLLTLFFGFWGANDGCQTLAFYRGGSLDAPMEHLAVADAESRANIVAAYANLAAETEAAQGARHTVVDLARQLVVTPEGAEIPFSVDARKKEALLEGLDDIALTLRFKDNIDAWYAADRKARAWAWESVER